MAKLSTDLERAFLSPVPTPSDGEVLTQQLVSLGDILQLAAERTFGFLLAVLSLPSALPIPAPGYSTPFGIVLLLLGWQLLVGASTPWLPPPAAQAHDAAIPDSKDCAHSFALAATD